MKERIKEIMYTAFSKVLFEMNDESTRENWKNDVCNKMKDIMNESEFTVICDETINDVDVVVNNRFVGRVLYKDNESGEVVVLESNIRADGITI